MASSSPLAGIALVDCARANAEAGLAAATERCGYGDDESAFQEALKTACAEMGVDINELSDLMVSERPQWTAKRGIEVGPDTPGDL